MNCNLTNEQWIEKIKIDFHNWFEDKRANLCSERQWQAVEDLLDNRDYYWKGYKARAEQESACVVCRDGWGVDLSRMADEITSLKSQLSEKDKKIERLRSRSLTEAHAEMKMILDEKIQQLESRNKELEELAEDFIMYTEHAIDLGYLGEGSTLGMFNQGLAKAKKLLNKDDKYEDVDASLGPNNSIKTTKNKSEIIIKNLMDEFRAYYINAEDSLAYKEAEDYLNSIKENNNV